MSLLDDLRKSLDDDWDDRSWEEPSFEEKVKLRFGKDAALADAGEMHHMLDTMEEMYDHEPVDRPSYFRNVQRHIQRARQALDEFVKQVQSSDGVLYQPTYESLYSDDLDVVIAPEGIAEMRHRGRHLHDGLKRLLDDVARAIDAAMRMGWY